MFLLSQYCDIADQGTLPLHIPLDTGENEYLVEQRCVRLVPSAAMAAVLYALKRELKWYTIEQIQWPGVICVKRT